jgi:hypothetical protein
LERSSCVKYEKITTKQIWYKKLQGDQMLGLFLNDISDFRPKTMSSNCDFFNLSIINGQILGGLNFWLGNYGNALDILEIWDFGFWDFGLKIGILGCFRHQHEIPDQ